jgi:hypothetical protein
MAADGLRAVVLIVMVLALAAGRLTAVEAVVTLGLLATAEVFADNTSATLAPMLVHRDDLAIANARLQTGFITLNQLIGPPIGAALFAAGRAWPFASEMVVAAASRCRGSPCPRSRTGAAPARAACGTTSSKGCGGRSDIPRSVPWSARS